MKKCSLFLKPTRIREMVQADDGTNSTLHESIQQLTVALQSRWIPSIRFRLNATPFHRKPQSIDAHLACQIEVTFRVGPPIAGHPRTITGLDPAQLFPVCPLAVVVGAFDLVGSGGNSPQETFGEL